MKSPDTKHKKVAEIIINQVAQSFGVHRDNFVRENNRLTENMMPRHTAMWLMRLYEMPFHVIAGIFKKNHSTVIHSVRTVDNLMETNPQYCKQVNGIHEDVKVKVENIMIEKSETRMQIFNASTTDSLGEKINGFLKEGFYQVENMVLSECWNEKAGHSYTAGILYTGYEK